MKGYIYIIRCSLNDMYYIGSTCTTIEKRFASHLSSSKHKKCPIGRIIDLYGRQNFTIEKLFEKNVDHKREIMAIEADFIELYKKYDGNCLNASIPLTYLKNIDDYYKNWYMKNRDKVKKSVKSNRVKNKTKYNEYMRVYLRNRKINKK